MFRKSQQDCFDFLTYVTAFGKSLKLSQASWCKWNKLLYFKMLWMKLLGYFSKKKKSINPFNNVGLAITTLVVGKKMLPKGIFFSFFFLF